jgi:hypothetical protein
MNDINTINNPRLQGNVHKIWCGVKKQKAIIDESFEEEGNLKRFKI